MQSSLDPESLQASLHKAFGDLSDPRIETACAHPLLNIITIALFATLAGADGWQAIETYGQSKRDWLATFLDLANGIPSRDTFARVFARLDPLVLEARFQDWVGLIAGQLGTELIAIDGKTLRGSYDRERGLQALQLVSAWASDQRLVLGQCAVDGKSNEITAIPLLLAQLALTGAIVSIDAMGTQTAIARQIRTADADYILALKGNHPKLSKMASDWFANHNRDGVEAPPEVCYSRCESGHHRIETRSVWQVPATEVFEARQIQAWEGLQTLVVVESTRQLWNKTTREVRFYISSVVATAEAFAGYVRSHWGVENQLHWCLDVTFSEDSCRIRRGHGAHNLSLLRRMALNLLRLEKSKGSLKMKRYRAGLDNQFLLKILRDSGLF